MSDDDDDKDEDDDDDDREEKIVEMFWVAAGPKTREGKIIGEKEKKRDKKKVPLAEGELLVVVGCGGGFKGLRP
jgi:hypothetical protein